MHEDHVDTDRTEAEDVRDDYAAPALTDLGSFEELTRLNPGMAGDLEGTS